MPEFYDSCPKNYQNTPHLIFAPPKNPEFYTIFARKNARIIIIIARKICFPNFGGMCPPSPTSVHISNGSGVIVLRNIQTHKWTLLKTFITLAVRLVITVSTISGFHRVLESPGVLSACNAVICGYS